MYLLDKNIFLEILLDQEKANSCEKLITSLSEDSPGWITAYGLHAISAILSHRKKDKALTTFLKFIHDHPFLFCYSTSLTDEIEIAHLTEKMPLDFDDTLHYYVAQKQKLTLVTLDQDFRKVKWFKFENPESLGFGLPKK